MNLNDDLQLRWVPTELQVKGADALIAAGVCSTDGLIWTAHVLRNKEFGLWSADVTVEPADGWFLNRDGASDAAKEAARLTFESDGVPCTGGYTVHRSGSTWAVFEDILARFGGKF